jgi:hypothetical protein
MFSALRGSLIAALLVCVSSLGAAQSRNIAPGFGSLPKDAQVAIAPLDVELFELSAGGVLSPKADWTAAANKHMGEALKRKAAKMGLSAASVSDQLADENAEVLHLHAAVARAISMHHQGVWKLPTKEDKLDWTFGDAMQPLRKATGARYGLFTWVRDSYASGERKAMMVGMALLGIGLSGGVQVGYATLVDLDTGQVLWFNQLISASGDLREEKPAADAVDGLLSGFPGVEQATDKK